MPDCQPYDDRFPDPSRIDTPDASPARHEPLSPLPSVLHVDLADSAALARLRSLVYVDVPEIDDIVTAAGFEWRLRRFLDDEVVTEPLDPAARIKDERGRVWARIGRHWLSPNKRPRTFADLMESRGILRTVPSDQPVDL